MRAVARFENLDTSNQWSINENIALILDAENGYKNFAFLGHGSGFLNGTMEGFALNIFSPSPSNNGITIDNGKYILIGGVYTGSVYLPTLTSMRESLAIDITTYFAVQITIVATASFTLFGYIDGSHGDTDEPRFYDNNHNSMVGGFQFSQTDTMQILLVYYGSYEAYVISHAT